MGLLDDGDGPQARPGSVQSSAVSTALPDATVRSPSPLVIVAFQSGARANGGFESLVRIVEVLPREVVIVTDREGDVAERTRAAGREVHVWKSDRIEPTDAGLLGRLGQRALRASTVGRFNEEIRRLMRSRGAQILLANDIRSFWHAAPGARVAGGRVVFTIRDMFLAGRPYGPKWRLTRHLADRIVTLSDEMRTETLDRIRPYASRGAAVDRIYSIVHDVADAPASPGERAALREQLGFPREGTLFIVVGSFCDKKNQLDLIRRGADQLLQSQRDATLAFVGDFDPEREPYARSCLEAATELHERARVRFVGFTRDVRRFYRAATVTCVASRYEGLARSMIESLAEGTPVTSFDVTSAREILEGHDAGLVRVQGDYRGLVDQLVLVATDERRRLLLAINGIATARRMFGAHAAADAYERVFQALEEPQSRGE